MNRYDDTTDMAYFDDLATVAVHERQLFEETITATGVPPSMRHRARLNLFAACMEGGVEAVTAIRDRCFERNSRAAAWLASHDIRL
ncbi:hypothetical protein O9X98_04885 [Agrobacterium salinitolerans]|nr:hypothetical protein [Agrobacterium salinitolerans]